tara:strand:+ start:185 stop:733 length:549 start_codon:yes stop_codon:yes gene_type:complete
MITFIALLRGINVSGQKKIKMTDLGSVLRQLGLQEVVTYIQSGNVVFKTSEVDPKKLAVKIHNALEANFGFDIHVVVRTKTELERILVQSPYKDPKAIEANKIYYVLLHEEPDGELIQDFVGETFINEQFVITKDCVYLACSNGYGKAKLNNNLIERKLKVAATTRNHRTLTKLLELAEEMT